LQDHRLWKNFNYRKADNNLLILIYKNFAAPAGSFNTFLPGCLKLMAAMKIYSLLSVSALLLITGITATAQTWERIYGIPNRYENTYGVAHSYDQGITQATRVNWDALWLNKTDVDGNIIWSKYYKHASQGMYITCLTERLSDNSLLITGASSQLSEWGDPVLFKVNACGTLDWCKIWNIVGGNYGVQVLNTLSGDIILHTRYASESGGFDNRFQLVKLDANGNFLWIKHIMPQSEYPNIINEDMYSLTNTSDHGFLFGGRGYYRDTANPDLFWLRNMVVKCNSEGDEEWVGVYFTQRDEEEFRGVIGSVFELNGNYYAGGTRYLKWGNQTIASTPVLLKTDNTGNLLSHHHMFGDSIVFSLPWAFDVINDTAVFMVTRTTPSLAQGVHIGMIITDSLGNINKALDNENGYAIEDCLTKTHDDKYIVTGGVYSDNEYDAYALKVNSQLEWDTLYNGNFTYDSLCPFPIDSTVIICNCDITTGLKTSQTDKREERLVVYPNPAGNQVAVILPVSTSYSSVELCDLFGRLALKKETDVYDTEVVFDISSLHEGYYIINLINNNKILMSGKLLKK
jgi:hypothetical protein